MRKAHRNLALIAGATAAAAGAVAGMVWLRGREPSGSLVLPRDAGRLVRLAASSRDAGDLRDRLAAEGVSSIRVEGECLPPPAWTPEASDNYADLWRRCTDGTPGSGLFRLSRRPGRARPIGLAEPPGLVELAREGDLLMASGRVREARAAWARALLRAPSLAGLWTRVAEADRLLGRVREAERELGRALRCAGDHPDIYDRYAEFHAATGRPAAAAGDLETAAGLDEASVPRWIKAARALEAAGAIPRAAACARRALARDPGNAEAAAIAARLGERRQ